MREETDVIEQLRELGNSPLNTLDVLMTFLYFTVSGARLPVPVRAHKLVKCSEHTHTGQKDRTHSLREYLTALIILNDSTYFFWCRIRLDCGCGFRINAQSVRTLDETHRS